MRRRASTYRPDAFAFIAAEILLGINALLYCFVNVPWYLPAGWLGAMLVAWWAYRRAHW